MSRPSLLARESFWLTLLAAGVAALALAYLRYAWLIGFTHDEIEHSHVAFRILQGDLPYKDFYQVHLPAYWGLLVQLVRAFPFSIDAIIGARLVNLLALGGCAAAGWSLLRRLPDGRTRAASLAYLAAIVLLAWQLRFHLVRPDPLMIMLVSCGLVLTVGQPIVSAMRTLVSGLLLGGAVSLSIKSAPFALVIPVFILVQSWRDSSRARSFRVLAAYALGIALAQVPTLAWLLWHDLTTAFAFDVLGLNAMYRKPLLDSLFVTRILLIVPGSLGIVVLWADPTTMVGGKQDNRHDEGGNAGEGVGARWMLTLWLIAGLLLALLATHSALHNLQGLLVPIAVGFAVLAGYVWRRAPTLLFRVSTVAILLGYPAQFAGPGILLLQDRNSRPQHEVQQLIDLASPEDSTCTGFAPVHPVFCRSVSELSILSDLLFARRIRNGAQRDRLDRVWREGIDRTIEARPDIIVRHMSPDIWAEAVDEGLITQRQLDALDALEPEYDVRRIGNSIIWLRR